MNEHEIAGRVASRAMEGAESVEEMYDRLEADVKALMKWIDGLLKKHRREFGRDPTNYGFGGDLGHVKELLEEVRDFLR